ncbi:hypothetical protein GCK72_001021 [Caenorhabditis remanei]|uniref:Uncharacterized protein n=1 Tax=Caenorhabditis remanei TaxID=31234 RepID=A0A6A5HS97_CAERE|nr:hypothetical protein GCK72_001021 [Caenorhabditis remanei]KAF1769207.1 hypothetical protein GCK72_001021 [Caenorhabditis remanei]
MLFSIVGLEEPAPIVVAVGVAELVVELELGPLTRLEGKHTVVAVVEELEYSVEDMDVVAGLVEQEERLVDSRELAENQC